MKKTVLGIMMIILSLSALASTLSVEFDKTKLALNDTVNFTVTVDGKINKNSLDIKGIDDFNILGKMQSSSISIDNGSISQKLIYTYTLQAKSLGTKTLQVEALQGKTAIKSSKATLDVTKATSQSAPQANSSNSVSSAQNPLAQLRQSSSQNQNSGDMKLITTVLPKSKTLYFGQKMLLDYNLYTNGPIQNLGFAKPLSYDDFMTKNLLDGKVNQKRGEIKGKPYTVYNFYQLALTPMKTGVLTIPENSLAVTEVGGSFFSAPQNHYEAIPAEKLSVLPLPTQGKPADFSGIVGNLSLTYDMPNIKSVKTNQEVVLKVKLSGDVNLDTLSKLPISAQNFSVYQSETQKSEGIKNGHYNAEKSFDIILVPLVPGKLTIPAIDLNYFDPVSKTYKVASIPKFSMNVTGSAVNASTVSQAPPLVISQVNDTAQVADKGVITLKIKTFWLKILALLIGIFLLFFVVTVIRKKKRRNQLQMNEKVYKKQFLRCKSVKDAIGILDSYLKAVYGLSSYELRDRASIIESIKKRELITQIYQNYHETLYSQHDKSQDILSDIQKLATLL